MRGEDAEGEAVPPLKSLVVRGFNHLPRDQHVRWSEYNHFFSECEDCLPPALKEELVQAYKRGTVDIALTNRTFQAITPFLDPLRSRGGRVNVILKLGTLLRARAVEKATAKRRQRSDSSDCGAAARGAE